MGTTQEDFVWVSTDEPHKQRRKEMLKKYPQIEKLYGHDPNSKYKVFFSMFLQLCTCYLISTYDYNWLGIFVLAYVWGGTINHSLMLAVHELSHDLFFPKQWQNVWFGIYASLSLGLPISLGFKKYHLIHHTNQGIAGVDPDLPTSFEGKYVRGPILKFFFLVFQGLIYVFRPLLTLPMPLTNMEVVAYVSQFLFDWFILQFFGGKALLYLIIGTVLGCGIHPLAAHFVGEHYVWDLRYETYSYYGPLNYLVYNVGWHNEHHDFPRIPGSRLPQLHKIAPEYYKDVGVHTSWPGVLWRFIFDPTITPFSRVERNGVKKEE
jgi:sphingolipid delta-4 desaturase